VEGSLSAAYPPKKVKHLSVRMTEKDYRRIMRLAESEGKSISSWVESELGKVIARKMEGKLNG